jgi:hypothetical protein
MKTITEALEEQIPHGRMCNPNRGPHRSERENNFPSLKGNCPYNPIGIYCFLHDEFNGRGGFKICGFNMEEKEESL